MKKIAITLGALALAIGAASPALANYSGPKIKFRLAHTAPPGNHITLAYQEFANLVKEKSGGKIQAQVFPGAVLGSDRVLVEGAQKGSFEIGVSSTPNLANFSPLYQVFDLPYITEPQNQEKFYKSMDAGGPLNTYFKKVANDIGLEPVMYAEYGYRNFVAVGRPLTKAADLKGLKLRTTDSPVEVDVAKALSSNPAPIAWGEVYTALQQGTIDAEGNTFPHLFGAKHNEVLKYAITSSHNYGMQVAMANKKWWDGLPEEARGLINEAAAEALHKQRTDFYPKNEADARKGFVASGITIHEASAADIAEFRKLTQPVFDKYAAGLPADLVKLVQDTQK